MTAHRVLMMWLIGAVTAATLPCSASASRTRTRRLNVRVVEVAGGRAYLKPGSAEGIRIGDSVRIDKRRFKVVAVNTDSAVVERRRNRPALGARGSARVRVKSRRGSEPLPAPEPLDAYRGQWAKARLPAADQSPRAVTLGSPKHAGTARALLTVGGAAIIPAQRTDEALGRGLVRGRLHYEPLHEHALALDADATAQHWFGDSLSSRPGAAARFPLFVRELALRYGRPRDLHAAIGRLRQASQMLGMLDGVRTHAPLGAGLSASAFGGTVPDPIDGAPALDVSRFGGELAWEDPKHRYQPHVVVGGHGSYFDGGIDERRVNALADIYPDFGRLGAHLEMSFLEADNPWNASTTQVSSAGVDALVDTGPLELGGRFAVGSPERSRWLAQFFDPEWLCASATESADPAAGGCGGDELFFGGQLDARTRSRSALFTIGANADGSTESDAQQLGGFTHLRLLGVWRTLRIDSSASYSHGSLMRGGRLLLGLGYGFADGLVDVSVHYQPGYLTYRADLGSYLEHEAGVTTVVLAGSTTDITLAADYITGRDMDLVVVQSVVSYRP